LNNLQGHLSVKNKCSLVLQFLMGSWATLLTWLTLLVTLSDC